MRRSISVGQTKTGSLNHQLKQNQYVRDTFSYQFCLFWNDGESMICAGGAKKINIITKQLLYWMCGEKRQYMCMQLQQQCVWWWWWQEDSRISCHLKRHLWLVGRQVQPELRRTQLHLALDRSIAAVAKLSIEQSKHMQQLIIRGMFFFSGMRVCNPSRAHCTCGVCAPLLHCHDMPQLAITSRDRSQQQYSIVLVATMLLALLIDAV